MAWFAAGLAGVLAALIPSVLLGRDAIFTYHDQLDGELIAYLLQARHLFQGDILPEFMGGMSKTALTLPAPLCVLLFLGGDGYGGLTALLFMGKVCGYVGMYLLCRETVKERWISAVMGGLYALLPFLPVYGLSQFGIPLLFWCALQLKERKNMVAALCGVALYTLCSSLVLVGFGLIGMGFVLLALEFFRCRQKTMLMPFLSGLLLMAGLYAAENARLIWQLLGNGSLSHKAEYVLNPTPFFSTFIQSFIQGQQHSEDHHGLLSAVTIVAAAVWIFWLKAGKRSVSTDRKRDAVYLLRITAFCLCWNIFFALLAALWGSTLGVALRSSLSVLGAFHLDRLLWIAPCLWYLAGACGISLIWKMLKERESIAMGLCCGILAAAAIFFTGAQVLLSGDIKSNVQKLRNPDYGLLSFRDYYAIGVMEQVEEFLYQETGQSKEEYLVASLGIDPAAALYHGFWCLDGYSNNYSLEYKHVFRQIIEPELEKSSYLSEYFDGWGNRCYLFSAEIPGYYTVEKNGFWFQDYELDGMAFREMGGKYIFSAAYIMNAEEQGLVLLREQPFETEGSYYAIYVYEVE